MATTKSYTQMYFVQMYSRPTQNQYILTEHTVSIHHAVAAYNHTGQALRPRTTWVNTSQPLTELQCGTPIFLLVP